MWFIHFDLLFVINQGQGDRTKSSWDSYCSWQREICNSVPCCYKDPCSREAQVREVLVNVLCGLCKDTARGVLTIWNNTIATVINICPEWRDEVSSTITWELVWSPAVKWSIKSQVSIVVDLKQKKINK